MTKPGRPWTPMSSFRIPPWLKEEARAMAAQFGETLTDAVVEGLKLYLADREKRRRSSTE